MAEEGFSVRRKGGGFGPGKLGQGLAGGHRGHLARHGQISGTGQTVAQDPFLAGTANQAG